MQQIKTITLTALITLCLFAAATGCKKNVDIGAQRNKVLFWNNDPIVGDSIKVTLTNNAGEAVAYITRPTVAADCDAQGVARFSTKNWGYTYHAESNWGWVWDGGIEAKEACNIYELDTKDAVQPQYRVAFWSKEAANGDILVDVDQSFSPRNITTTTEATTCAWPDIAFEVSPGTHTYTATMANGKSWQGTFNAAQPCNIIELK